MWQAEEMKRKPEKAVCVHTWRTHLPIHFKCTLTM